MGMKSQHQRLNLSTLAKVLAKKKIPLIFGENKKSVSRFRVRLTDHSD